MKITILVDNNSLIDQYYLAEPAFSVFIEDGGKRILFDCGYSDVFIKNAGKLGINLTNIDYLIFSHNHEDHTWGTRYFIDCINHDQNIKPILIAHPTIFRKTFVDEQTDISINMSQKEIEPYFTFQLSEEPIKLTENLIYLGEIPRLNKFEGNISIGTNKVTNKSDFMLDDTALAYKTDEGLVIITGCSHSGICNICEYAKKICNCERIIDIIGGLHLQNPEKKQMDATLDYIKNLNLKFLHAGHCTDLASKIKLAGVTNIQEIGAGVVLDF
jgi:7,8-dihydropterin-6-yl-methyl-4-(beta-D-ribofuranosyl)aminobenzene 5'-phosphate synthase